MLQTKDLLVQVISEVRAADGSWRKPLAWPPKPGLDQNSDEFRKHSLKGMPAVDRKAAQAMSLHDALTTEFTAPTYLLPYVPTQACVRINKSIFDHIGALEHIGGAISIHLAVIDVDDHEAPEGETEGERYSRVNAWFQDELQKIEDLQAAHPGILVYRSKNGYRIVGALKPHHHISSKDGAKTYKRKYTSWINYLGRVFDIKSNGKATADDLGDWGRFMRVPCDPHRSPLQPGPHEVFGDVTQLGFWDPPLIAEDQPPEPKKPAPSASAAAFSEDGCLLLQLVINRGLRCEMANPDAYSICCPRVDLHSAGASGEKDYESKTFLYTNGGGIGSIQCFSSGCQTAHGNDGASWTSEFTWMEQLRARRDLGRTKLGDPLPSVEMPSDLWGELREGNFAGALLRQGRDELKPEKTIQQCLHQVLCTAVEAEVKPEAIFGVCLDPEYGFSSLLKAQRDPSWYFEQAWQRAQEAVAASSDPGIPIPEDYVAPPPVVPEIDEEEPLAGDSGPKAPADGPASEAPPKAAKASQWPTLDLATDLLVGAPKKVRKAIELWRKDPTKPLEDDVAVVKWLVNRLNMGAVEVVNKQLGKQYAVLLPHLDDNILNGKDLPQLLGACSKSIQHVKSNDSSLYVFERGKYRHVDDKSFDVRIQYAFKGYQIHSGDETDPKIGLYKSHVNEIREHYIRSTDCERSSDDVILFRNGYLDLKTGILHPSNPALFLTGGPDCEYDPAATCPLWLEFLDAQWKEDPATIALLQEVMGLLLVDDISLHVCIVFLGPPRSGKGVMIRMINKLVGDEYFASFSITGLTETFGLENLIGKTVAAAADVRGPFDQKVKSAAREKILGIAGGDSMPVNRKNKSVVSQPLRTRMIMGFNESEDARSLLLDGAGATAARLRCLRTTTSFADREDRSLEARLELELPGIANWAMEGLARLRKQGFTLNKGTEMLRESTKRTGVAEFLEEVPLGYPCKPGDAHIRYAEWCKERNQKPAPLAWFVSQLRDAQPGLMYTENARSCKAEGCKARFRALYMGDVPTTCETHREGYTPPPRPQHQRNGRSRSSHYEEDDGFAAF